MKSLSNLCLEPSSDHCAHPLLEPPKGFTKPGKPSRLLSQPEEPSAAPLCTSAAWRPVLGTDSGPAWSPVALAECAHSWASVHSCARCAHACPLLRGPGLSGTTPCGSLYHPAHTQNLVAHLFNFKDYYATFCSFTVTVNYFKYIENCRKESPNAHGPNILN